ncbi:PDZ domain-containing protein [Caulobacter segnis]|uniref:Protease Do n=2 Tax=Caulobacter segnis TaxID=88688 RepID=D5VG14_CAUST|nr:Do family serine endopeptidase [Caulobacter segnis]ADG10017.1 protease Do [Caulobacter segnis ATCC 21756]AVQ01773.1 PDZ domain-containing protein [Caulobacter segnis]
MKTMRNLRALLPVVVLLTACSNPTGQSNAQSIPDLAQPTRRAPSDPASMKASFSPVVKKAAPAVVNVASRRVVRQRVDPFWDFFMGGGAPREQVQGSLGSGAVVRADGVIITNHHNIEGIVEGNGDITVQLADRREFPATVLLDDPRADLAVLKIDTKGERLPVMAIDDQEQLEVGDLVLALGNPFGVGQTVTNGIVSALARTDVGAADFGSYIQTDAAINPGNSGGPLVDMDGDLVGINTFIISRSGSSSGVGFAIPAAVVKQVVNAALGGGHSVVRPWLGVKGQSVTAEIARSLGMSAPRGVLVAQVYPGSSADRAGLKEGDVILSIDGQAVNDEGGGAFAIGTHKVGDRVTMQIRRNERDQTLTVRAEAAPDTPARDERVIKGRNPFDGATVVNLSPAAAQDLGVDPFAGRGVLITRVGQGYALNAGLRPGDFVREINGRPINSVADLNAAVAAQGRAWTVTIERQGQRIAARLVT